jgi:hypothetical protein
MPIYRGAGGAGDATADGSSEALLIRELAIEVQADADAASDSATAAASSASGAATSATNASNSATAAATSATNASNSASAASTSATNAANSATAAQTAETAAELAETNAETAETNAETAATNAASSASAASTSSTNASNSASAASTSATNASNSASAASTSASNASTSATAAAGSASSASTSASNAATSETNAANSATSASTSATTATTQAGIATTKAGEAATSATNAATSATTATTQAGIATTQATNASNSASAAATSATNASNSASSASTSATNAANSASAAAASAASINLSSIAITGGSINGTTVGATTASTGNFTTLGATGVATFSAGTNSAPAITTSGDTNTGIFFPAADTIAFTEGGVESMRIDSSANVGIGTSSPNTKLEVRGNELRIYDTGTSNVNLSLRNSTTGDAAGFGLQQDGVNTILYNGSNGYMSFYTNTNERMRIGSSGNVGIGTSSPAQKLDVAGDITFGSGNKFVSVSNALNGATGQNGARIRSAISSSENPSFSNVDDTNTGMFFPAADTIGFTTGATERIRIDSSGNLLVGTTTASGKIVSFGATNAAFWGKNTGGASDATFVAWNAVTTGNPLFADFYTETSATQRGSIAFNRGAGITTYNTTSDYRAKDIISPVLNSGEVIDSVPVYIGKMKGATQARPMFIAHETPDYAHTGEKDAVDKDGNPVYQQMDASSLMPVLWAEVQSLRKRLALLESK